MSAAIAAALKKIAVSLLTNKRVLKVVVGIILGIIIIILMPIAALLGVLSGDFIIDTDLLREEIMENMPDELADKLDGLEGMMSDIESAMTDAGTENRIREAHVLYTMALSDKASGDGFVEALVGCFTEDQTYDELIETVNDTFGTDISVGDFERVMGSMGAPKTEINTETACYTIGEHRSAAV